MGYVSRHIFKWFRLTLILLNDGKQLYNGFRNAFNVQWHGAGGGGGGGVQCCQIISQ